MTKKTEQLIARCNYLTYFITARQLEALTTEELQIDDESKGQLVAVLQNRFNELQSTVDSDGYIDWLNETNSETLLKDLGEKIRQSIINLK